MRFVTIQDTDGQKHLINPLQIVQIYETSKDVTNIWVTPTNSITVPYSFTHVKELIHEAIQGIIDVPCF